LELAGTELPDIYVSQVVFAPIRTKGNRSDLKVTGKDSAGRPLTVQLRAQDAKTDLPKLIWMKRRIESLLQSGKTKEAIALAEKANLVCDGAAFIAWDDTERVAIAQDEVYQPSLDIPSGLPQQSRHVSFSISESSFFESEVGEWWNAAALPDVESVSDIVDLAEPELLTEQLSRAIKSVFCPDDAKKLTSIVLDWAKHVDNKHVRDTLRALLRECERVGDQRKLRKVLSNFFLALPDPWQTKAGSIFSALTATRTRVRFNTGTRTERARKLTGA
jgi:hypothetical protein